MSISRFQNDEENERHRAAEAKHEKALELLARAHGMFEGQSRKLVHEIANFLWDTPMPQSSDAQQETKR